MNCLCMIVVLYYLYSLLCSPSHLSLMWQRIQTLYLLLTLCIQWGSLFIPLGSYTDGDRAGQSFYLLGDIATSESIILAVIVTLLAGWAIVTFKNRKKQMQLCGFLTIFTILAPITTIASTWIFALEQPSMPEFHYAYLIFPIAVIAFPILAKKAIRKDDELVRSSNRLR